MVNCFRCGSGGAGLEMVLIRDSMYKCVLCEMVFDEGHAKITEKELMDKGYITLANEELANQWFEYFEANKFPDIVLIKHGIGHLIINNAGLDNVRKVFLKRRNSLIEELSSVENVLDHMKVINFRLHSKTEKNGEIERL